MDARARIAGDLVVGAAFPEPLPEALTLLGQGELSILNLETPLLVRGRADTAPNLSGAPTAVARQLAEAGVTIVTLANNHAFDAGAEGLRSTFAALDGAGIAWAGAGEDLRAASRPLVWSGAGVTVGVLAVFVAFPVRTLEGFGDRAVAGPARPGVYAVTGVGSAEAPRLEQRTVASLLDAVTRARVGCDLLVVSLHYHWPYVRRSEAAPEIADLFRRVVDAGADLVAAHGPHEMRGVEPYGRGFIAHGLGSFAFQLPTDVEDEIRTYFSSDPRFWQSLVIEVPLAAGRPLEAVRCQPLALHREGDRAGLPYLPAGAEAAALLDALERDCRRLGGVTRHEPHGILRVTAS